MSRPGLARLQGRRIWNPIDQHQWTHSASHSFVDGRVNKVHTACSEHRNQAMGLWDARHMHLCQHWAHAQPTHLQLHSPCCPQAKQIAVGSVASCPLVRVMPSCLLACAKRLETWLGGSAAQHPCLRASTCYQMGEWCAQAVSVKATTRAGWDSMSMNGGPNERQT